VSFVEISCLQNKNQSVLHLSFSLKQMACEHASKHLLQEQPKKK